MQSTGVSNLVSVIIPTYNRSKLLAEAIQSVVFQTYRPVKYLVIDDGSTDNTKEVVETVADKTDKNFVLKICFPAKCWGTSGSQYRHKAEHRRFIQYIDSDVILHLHKLEQQVNDGVFGDGQLGTIEKNDHYGPYKRRFDYSNAYRKMYSRF